MPNDLASFLLRRSVRRVRDDELRCHDCGRAPLTGELMHESDERVLCSLCVARIPADKRDRLESRRVHAGGRPLAVVRRAA